MAQVQIDAIFHALADPTRRSMLELIGERPRSASSLAEPLGVSLTAVGQHLHVLEACGLARTQKLGRVRTCQADPRGLAALDSWLRDRRRVWESRLDRLGEIAAED